MKISVVMATYNGAAYIEEQLDSILPQLSQGDQLIICDDCSKDQTVTMIKQYILEKDKEHIIELHQNEKNLGFQNNFNKALQLADGDYIFFSDQDDIWLENKISVMIDTMKNEKDCLLLCSDYEPFRCTEDAPMIPVELKKKMPNNGSVEKIKMTPKSVYIGALGCCMCMSREFRERIEPYWFEEWAQDDRCWRMALSMQGLYVIHENLVKHRLHGNNTATYGKYHTIEKRVKLFESMRDAAEKMLACLKSNVDKEAVGRDVKLLSKNIKMFEMRITLLKNKKILNCIPLLGYLKYYQAVKSYLVEILMALKNKQ